MPCSIDSLLASSYTYRMSDSNLLLAIIAVLLGGCGWFIKKILDKTDEVARDIADMKPKLEVLWGMRWSIGHSPRQLNPDGARLLNSSNIQKIIDEKKGDLLRELKQMQFSNSYDAEIAVLEAAKKIPEKYPELLPQIKEGAFRGGADVDSVLFVGGLYLRNQIFTDLGFKVDDLDALQK